MAKVVVDDDVEEFFDFSVNTAKRVFKEFGRLEIGMCLMRVNHPPYIFQLPVPMAGDKDMASKLIHAACTTIRPFALSFMTECFTLAAPSGISQEEFKKLTKVNVSKHPDRKEAIVIVNETKLISRSVVIMIERDSKGQPYFGETITTNDIRGRFTNFLRDLPNDN